ncbi:RDD family protein [Candidatus Avelusimicrobium sp.]
MTEENQAEHRINIMDTQTDLLQTQTETEESRQDGPQVAGVMERFVALMIDAGLVLVGYQIFLWVLLKFYAPQLEQIIWLALGVLIPFIIYETIFTCGGRSTLGKKLVGIAVVDVNTGEPLGFFRSFVRAVGYVFSGAILMCGFLLAFVDDHHRALQDFLAGSVVMQARPKGFFEKVLLTCTGSLFVIIFSFSLYSQLFGAGSWVQKRLVLQAKDHLEQIGYLQEVHRTYFGVYTNDLLRLSLLSGDPVQFQRDTQKVLDRKGFKIGVSEKGYKITARAKDARKTPVYYPSR